MQSLPKFLAEMQQLVSLQKAPLTEEHILYMAAQRKRLSVEWEVPVEGKFVPESVPEAKTKGGNPGFGTLGGSGGFGAFRSSGGLGGAGASGGSGGESGLFGGFGGSGGSTLPRASGGSGGSGLFGASAASGGSGGGSGRSTMAGELFGWSTPTGQ